MPEPVRSENAFFLVRHGETEWSRDRRHTGRTDIPLLDEGRRQAELIGAALHGRRFTLVLTSSLQRALQTCRLAGFGEEAQVREDLREWDYGDDEGRTTAEIRVERPDWSLWVDGAPGGESPEDIGRRADRILQEVRVATGDAIAFAHAHVLRVIAARWLGLPPSDGRLFALSTATLSVLSYEHHIPVLLRWNEEVAAAQGGAR